jgi:hypothetical protein
VFRYNNNNNNNNNNNSTICFSHICKPKKESMLSNFRTSLCRDSLCLDLCLMLPWKFDLNAVFMGVTGVWIGKTTLCLAGKT